MQYIFFDANNNKRNSILMSSLFVVQSVSLLAEGISVSKPKLSSSSIYNHNNTSCDSNCDNENGNMDKNNNTQYSRLQVLLPDCSNYDNAIQDYGNAYGDVIRNKDRIVLLSPTPSSLSLLSDSGFSSPIIQRNSNAVGCIPNGGRIIDVLHSTKTSTNNYETANESTRHGTDAPICTTTTANREGFGLRTPSTSDSNNLMYNDGERTSSGPTSESCSPHVRLCGSRASCGPMWTKEDLTMLDMVYNLQLNGNQSVTPSSDIFIRNNNSNMSSAKGNEFSETPCSSESYEGDIKEGNTNTSSVAKQLLMIEDSLLAAQDQRKKNANEIKLPVEAFKCLQLNQTHPTTA